MSLEGFQKKIKTITDLKDVVSTMKMLSSVQVGTYEKMGTALRSYQRNLRQALIAVAPQLPPGVVHKIKESPKTLAIVIGTDTGLVGGFNKDVWRFVRRYFDQGNEKPVFLFVGRRLASFFDKPLAVYPVSNAMKEFSVFLTEVVNQMDTFVQTRGQKVLVFYQRKAEKGQEKLVVRQLLPFPMTYQNDLKGQPWGRCVPMVPKVQAVWEHLKQEYLKVWLLKALIASQIAEHHKRMINMQQAEKNISEELDRVNLLYQQARQNVITEELIDIVSGAEVLKKKSVPCYNQVT